MDVDYKAKGDRSVNGSSGMNINLSQKGNVLIFCLFFMVLAILVVSFSFNASRISAEKTRLQNTADAAAYSIASIEARDLNFKAYTNRAMVANQVALAQSVSLISWARFFTRFSDNLSKVMSLYPPLRIFFSAVSQGISSAMKAVEAGLKFSITVLNTIEQILSVSQASHHIGTIAIAKEIFADVVEKNDPEVDRGISFKNGPFLAKYLNDHMNFTKMFSPKEVTRSNKINRFNKKYKENKRRMDEFRSVTLASRDGFSKNRTYDWVKSFTVLPLKLKLKVVKTGGSELTGSSKNPNQLGDFYTWSAMDTLSIHRQKYKCRKLSCKWRSWSETVPVGWGATATRGERPFIFERGLGGRSRYANTYRINRKAAKFGSVEYQALRGTGQFNGLRAFYDIKKDGLIAEAPGIAVMLTKPHGKNALETVKQTGFGGGSGQLDIEEAGGLFRNRLTALSQAVPYFSRPNDVSVFRRADRRREYGNLYNPFWQPRLSELKDKDRLLRLAATLP